jgi:hypothetical protein
LSVQAQATLRSYSCSSGCIPYCLLNRLDHVFDDLLRITEDHHGFIHVEEFVIKASKNRDLGLYKKEQEKPNLLS